MKNQKLVTVHFEDNGQDFLSFDISFYADYKYGKVVNVNPEFQKDIWVNMVVLSGKPEAGKHLTVSKAPGEDVIEIKHSIERVDHLVNSDKKSILSSVLSMKKHTQSFRNSHWIIANEDGKTGDVLRSTPYCSLESRLMNALRSCLDVHSLVIEKMNPAGGQTFSIRACVNEDEEEYYKEFFTLSPAWEH